MDVSVEQEREILNQSRRESERQLDLVHQEHQKIKGRIQISNIFNEKKFLKWMSSSRNWFLQLSVNLISSEW